MGRCYLWPQAVLPTQKLCVDQTCPSNRHPSVDWLIPNYEPFSNGPTNPNYDDEFKLLPWGNKCLNDEFINEREWEWTKARASWSSPLTDLGGIACKVTSSLTSLLRPDVMSGRPFFRCLFFKGRCSPLVLTGILQWKKVKLHLRQ